MYQDGIKVVAAQASPEDEARVVVVFPDGQYMDASTLSRIIDPVKGLHCGLEGCIHERINEVKTRIDWPAYR